MILEKKQQSVRDWLEDYFGLRYDPNSPKYRDAPKPDTPTPTKKPTPTKTGIVGDNVKYSVKTGTWQREIVGESTDNNADKSPTKTDKTTDTKRRVADNRPTTPTSFEWDLITAPTNTAELNQDRQEKLTATDLKLIQERGLDIAKAQTIKAFWFKKVPRNLAAGTLSKQAKGYSEAIINPYYTVFNLALKTAESPTLEAK